VEVAGPIRLLASDRGHEREPRLCCDVEAFLAASDVVGGRLSAAKSQPPGALLGVAKLAFPGLMIEIEATAAK
jgi:enamine deaminase RidA (YjgF/YER057c/UK114 family)